MKRETLEYILSQANWTLEDTEEVKEARLNNIRDELMNELGIDPNAPKTK